MKPIFMHNSYMQIKIYFKKAIDSKKVPFSLNILGDLTKAPDPILAVLLPDQSSLVQIKTQTKCSTSLGST